MTVELCNSDDDAKEPPRIVDRKSTDAQKIFNEFCDASTIHGLKYLGTRPLYEKLLWGLIFIVSLMFCGYQIKATWDKWADSPVIVTFNENLVSIAEISFPAVTLCHQIKVKKDFFNYDDYYEQVLTHGLNQTKIFPTEQDQIIFELLSQMCIKDNSRNVTRLLINNFSKEDTVMILQLLERISPTLEETFTQCGGHIAPNHWPCNDVLSRVMVEDGYCYTFNFWLSEELVREGTIINVVDRAKPKKPSWSLDFGNAIDTDEDDEVDLPCSHNQLRAYTTGQKLQIRLSSNVSELAQNCQGTGYRFKVILHSPYEYPSTFHQSYDVDFRQAVTLSVIPKLMLASETLKLTYAPAIRRCYFHSERYLKYFQVYTKKNCELECLSNITALVCGCVPYWLPRDKSAPICNLKQYNCVHKYSYRKLNYEMAATSVGAHKTLLETRNTSSNKAKKSNMYEKFDNHRFNCNCLSACNTMKYDADVREVKLVNSEGVLDPSNETIEHAKLIVQYKESEFFAMKRSELYGMTDFIANCGGLLGLFIGVSLLSFVEVIYFFTLKCFSTYKLFQKAKVSTKITTQNNVKA